MNQTVEQQIQEEQYSFPYHHLVTFGRFNNQKTLHGGLNYFGYVSRLITIISGLEWKSLLDIGCGDGKLIYELAPKLRDRNLTGLDYSKKAISFATAFNFENTNTKFFSSYDDINNQQFDCITLVETLEHIKDNEVAPLAESIYSLLAPNGMFVICVPTTNDPLNVKHFRHYDEDLVIKSFPKLKILSSEYCINNSWLFYWVVWFSGKFGKLPGVNQLALIIGKKYFFKANPKNGSHIICVFQKKSYG